MIEQKKNVVVKTGFVKTTSKHPLSPHYHYYYIYTRKKKYA